MMMNKRMEILKLKVWIVNQMMIKALKKSQWVEEKEIRKNKKKTRKINRKRKKKIKINNKKKNDKIDFSRLNIWEYIILYKIDQVKYSW